MPGSLSFRRVLIDSITLVISSSLLFLTTKSMYWIKSSSSLWNLMRSGTKDVLNNQLEYIGKD